ncbi:MAG: tautomerase family protein [Ignavibacteriae bacterium]|nr:MAG: tautomerase family protein [Ignavibacteriota bacterium]
MPIVRIELYNGFNAGYRKQILDGVHQALVDAFHIPDSDRNQLMVEFDDDHFERSANKSRSFTIIEITAFKGRSREAKRMLYQKIVGNLKASPGIDPKDILIVVKEPELVNWGIHGGVCADETDIGFQVNV